MKNFTLPLGPDPAEDEQRPLADRMRPKVLDEVLGQEQVLGDGSLLRENMARGHVPSVIFWGPPGCGKTTIARLMADVAEAEFVTLSAISHNTADLRNVFERAAADKAAGKRTVVLVDEIHRYNRAQQDIFLPYIEDGTIILVGATTENPSFELNAALLSRAKVLVLQRLQLAHLLQLMKTAEQFTGNTLPLHDEARDTLAAIADGDGRYLLNLVEELLRLEVEPLTSEALLQVIQRRRPVYDKSRDGHYNLISALHKSLRGSDPQAGLYWLWRMLEGGEDRLYLLRRLVRFASEDIGMADPQALVILLAAKEAYDFLGSPEGELAIAHGVVYLATAPKSNAVYKASNIAQKRAKETGSLMPPKHILNAPTKLMKQEGYSDGYIYDHDTKEAFSGQDYFPDDMPRETYYTPSPRGFEKDIQKRLDYWDKLRERKRVE